MKQRKIKRFKLASFRQLYPKTKNRKRPLFSGQEVIQQEDQLDGLARPSLAGPIRLEYRAFSTTEQLAFNDSLMDAT